MAPFFLTFLTGQASLKGLLVNCCRLKILQTFLDFGQALLLGFGQALQLGFGQVFLLVFGQVFGQAFGRLLLLRFGQGLEILDFFQVFDQVFDQVFGVKGFEVRA